MAFIHKNNLMAGRYLNHGLKDYIMFADRIEAGKKLAEKLSNIKDNNYLVLAIPRGGVVVGDQIAQSLSCNLDIIVSKKITPPDQTEYGIGAIMHDGTIYWSLDMTAHLQNPYLISEINKKKKEAQSQLEEFRGNASYDLTDKKVILVDDGIATGSSVFVILKWLVKQGTKKIIVAAPVIPDKTYEQIKKICDVVAVLIPSAFYSVSNYYEKFKQVSDKEVESILSKYK